MSGLQRSQGRIAISDPHEIRAVVVKRDDASDLCEGHLSLYTSK